LASTTVKRIGGLPTTRIKIFGVPAGDGIENFAIFIDTHRDQPHVPSFENDIHRGMSRPTLVHYIVPDPSAPLGYLVRVEDGHLIKVDPKHKFVTTDWWQEFLVDFLSEHGESPVAMSGDAKGQLPTSHLRNARTRVYKLKSLRQIVREHEAKAAR
jgi:hypothetical protein